MAESNDTKDTTVKNENGKLTTPKTDGETSTKQDDPTLGAPQNEEKRELSDFEKVAEEGRTTAEKNLAAESKEAGDVKPGAENVTEKVTTSEAQTELRSDEDPATVKAKAKDAQLSDNADAQKQDNAVKVGRSTAKKNLKTESDEQTEVQEDKMSFEDAVAEGRKTAEKNHKAEVTANKAANS